MIDRRLLLLGSAFAVAGCAARTPDQCDPKNGDMFDYFPCRDAYGQRIGSDIEKLQQLRREHEAQQGTRRRLENEAAVLTQQLNETNAQISQLREERSDLEFRINRLRNDRREASALIEAVTSYLRRMDVLEATVINYRPPPLPDDPRIQASYRPLPALQNKAARAQKSIWEKLEELAKIAGETGVEHFLWDKAKEVLLRAVRDTAMDFLEGPIGFAFMLNDAREAWEFWEKAKPVLMDQ